MRKSARNSAKRARRCEAAVTGTGRGTGAEAASAIAPEAGPQAGEDRARRSRAEAELAADLEPQGALERMVVEQMAAAHVATMASFDRAEWTPNGAAPGGTAPDAAAREIELRLAARFMTLFLRQAATLERRRALVRQAEAVESHVAFDAALARDHARMTFWEESLRRFEEAASGAEAEGGDDLDALGDLGDLDDLDGLDDPGGIEDPVDAEALADMAARLGLPSPLDAAGNLDPAALEALVERTGPGMRGEPAPGKAP